MYKTHHCLHALSGLLLCLPALTAQAATPCDSATVSALLPAFKMPADVHVAWSENTATIHSSSQYFLLHTTRSLNRNDPNGLSQIFEAQLQLLGWHEPSADMDNHRFTSSWTLTDPRCGTLQASFNILQVNGKEGDYYGIVLIIRP